MIWSGLKPRMDEASKFLTCADEVYLMGDCTGKNGHLQKAIAARFLQRRRFDRKDSCQRSAISSQRQQSAKARERRPEGI